MSRAGGPRRGGALRAPRGRLRLLAAPLGPHTPSRFRQNGAQNAVQNGPDRDLPRGAIRRRRGGCRRGELAGSVLSFGDLALDPERGELRAAGERVDLSPLTLRLLIYLALNRARTVPIEELRAEVWQGVHVTEAALHQAVGQARRAVGDDGRRQQVIRTFARSGYRFVAEVREAATAPDSAPDTYLGRADLLRGLGDDVRAALAGQARVVLLLGEAGIGKTRTLDEVARLAQEEGALVARGSGSPHAGAPPFWPWVRVLRSLAAGRPVHALRREVETLAPGLLEAAPPAADGGPRRPGFAGAATRFRLFDEVTQCLRRASALGPVAILLDDLHAAGSAVLELFEFVVREIGSDASLLLVAAQRPAEALRSEAHAAALGRLMAESSLRVVQLEGLDEADSRELVARHEPRPLEPALVDALVARAEGNPFYLKELARALGREAPPADRPDDPAERVARGVQQLIAARLAALSPATRLWLRTASAIGPRFELALLARLVPGAEPEAAWGEAQRLGFVVEAPPGEGDAAFVHALVRDAVYAEIPLPERRALHLRLGETFLGDRLTEAAFHFAEAAPLGGVGRAVGLLRRAGDLARRHFDAGTAGELYARALKLLDDADDEEARCDLLIAYGETVVQSGLREEAWQAFEEALGIARRRGWGARFARATLAKAYSIGYDAVADPAVVGQLEEALARLGPGEEALRARLLSRLTIEVRYRQHGADEAERLLSEATACARRAGDAAALAQVLEDTTLVRWSAYGSPEWIELSRELVSAAREAGDDDLVFRGHVGLVTEYMQVGDRPAMEREVERCAELGRRFPAPHQRASVGIMQTARFLLDGDFASAERGIVHSLASGAPELTLPALTQLYYHRLETGRVAELEDQLRGLSRSEPHRDAWKLALARLMVEDGRNDAARMFLERSTAPAEIPRDRIWLPLVSLRAEVVAVLGDRAAAAELLELLRPYSSLNVVYGLGTLYYGSVAYFLGVLARSCGSFDAAEAHLRAAQAMHERMQTPPWTLRTRVELAALPIARGGTADAGVAFARLRHEAERLGMRRVLRRIDSLERMQGARGEEARKPAGERRRAR